MGSTETWYISCTAIWKDAIENDEFKKLESDLEDENKEIITSKDYKNYKDLKNINDSSIREWLVPKDRRHSTVLNILKVEVEKIIIMLRKN